MGIRALLFVVPDGCTVSRHELGSIVGEESAEKNGKVKVWGLHEVWNSGPGLSPHEDDQRVDITAPL